MCSFLFYDLRLTHTLALPFLFLLQLLDILTNEETTDVVSWLPHGNGFIIHKKKTFANEILPKYFKASKFTSFTRKLNRWGFARVPRGPETGAYFHKLFRRDKPEMALQMTSNSGNKYQNNPLQQQLLPNVPGMMMPGQGMYPFMAPMMQGNLTPQQQQALWMQHMMQLQQMQMMQMQQQQRMYTGAPDTPGAQENENAEGVKDEELPIKEEIEEGNEAAILEIKSPEVPVPTAVDEV
jgi:hypothetical protein